MALTLPTPAARPAVFAIGDEVFPNGFPELRAMVIGVTEGADGSWAYKTVWVTDAQGAGNLVARKGHAKTFRQDAWGNTSCQKIG